LPAVWSISFALAVLTPFAVTSRLPVFVVVLALMLGLQPPELPFPFDSATTGVAKATRKIASVRNEIHLFMRSILYELVG
jgi:hypothetical protein